MLSQRAHDANASEAGGVLVMVALFMPIIVLFIIFVIDVGDWFEHQRHLQTQADAAALAAAGDFRIPCTDTPIINNAMVYSGFTAPAYNAQVGGGQSRTHIMINSATYYNQSSPVDATVRTGGPCSAGMVDVKLTETDLPWFFGFGQVVKYINAHARVEIKPLLTSSGALPVGVPDVNPKDGKVILYNEDTNSVIASQPLKVDGAMGALVQWDNATKPLNFTMPNPLAGQGSAHVGVRIVLSGVVGDTTCGDPLVDCYELGTQKSLLFIQGYSTLGSGLQPNPPVLRDVILRKGTCTDGYFVTAACSINVRAKVDIGTLATNKADMTIMGGGCGNNGCALAFQTTGADAGYWTGNIPVSAGAGQVPLTLNWDETANSVTGLGTCKNGSNNPCKGTFGVVQRVYEGSGALSGPIQIAEVGEGGTAGGIDSLQSGTSHSLIVRIGITGSLQYASSVNDPPVYLRVNGGTNGNGNASQNQSLDCDAGGGQLWDELAHGCDAAYTVNTGTTCPNSTTALWGSPQPWQCVALQTGSATNDPARGLNTRVLGPEYGGNCLSQGKCSQCPAAGQLGHNNWSMFPNIPSGDPRIVEVFLTPFGTFDGSGSGTVPVTQFAVFYVTGWTANGQGYNNPCQGNGDDAVPNNDPGVIVGHFIKYVATLNTGGGGPGFCDLSTGSLSSGTCVAVLTQ